MKTVCDIQGLCFKHGDQPVLSGIDFSVRQSEMLAVVGPNGSGKTTLLRLLAGLESPSQGRLTLFETQGQELTARARAHRVAYVAQQEQTDIPFTVRDMVLLGRSPWLNALGGTNEEDYRIAESSLRQTHMLSLAHRPVAALSGGERQRASIARALCQTPDLYLLDEPTSALDYGHQISIMDLLRTLCKEQGAAVIVVLHDLNIASLYADRILVLKNGEIIGCGPPAQMLTARLLDSLYDCAMLVDTNPCTGTPRISPLPRRC